MDGDEWRGDERRAVPAGEQRRRWIEALWPLIVVGAGAFIWYGETKSEIDAMRKSMEQLAPLPSQIQTLQHRLERMGDTLEQEKRIAKLERREAFGKIDASVAALVATVEQHKVNFQQIWPRLRALDKNQSILQRGIERAGAEVNLEDPQKF